MSTKVKSLRRPKLKKLKVLKAFTGAQADTRSGKAMSPGTSANYSPGQGNRQDNNQTSNPITRVYNSVKPVVDAASMFMNPVLAVAKYGYSQFKKGKQNALDYEGQAAGVTPMRSPRPPITNTGGNDNNSYTTTVTMPKAVTPISNTSQIAANSVKNFMIKPGVSLADVSKASSGKLIQGYPKLAKKGWK